MARACTVVVFGLLAAGCTKAAAPTPTQVNPAPATVTTSQYLDYSGRGTMCLPVA